MKKKSKKKRGWWPHSSLRSEKWADHLNHKRIEGVGSRGPGQIEVGGRGREDRGRRRVEDKLLLDEPGGLGGGGVGVLEEERLPGVEVGRDG